MRSPAIAKQLHQGALTERLLSNCTEARSPSDCMAIVSRRGRRVIAWQSYRGAAFQTSDYYITAMSFSAVTIAHLYF